MRTVQDYEVEIAILRAEVERLTARVSELLDACNQKQALLDNAADDQRGMMELVEQARRESGEHEAAWAKVFSMLLPVTGMVADSTTVGMVRRATEKLAAAQARVGVLEEVLRECVDHLREYNTDWDWCGMCATENGPVPCQTLDRARAALAGDAGGDEARCCPECAGMGERWNSGARCPACGGRGHA